MECTGKTDGQIVLQVPQRVVADEELWGEELGGCAAIELCGTGSAPSQPVDSPTLPYQEAWRF